MRRPRSENCAVYSVDEVAVVLGISRFSAFAAVKNGDLRCIRIGKRILIPKHYIEKLFMDAERKAEQIRDRGRPPTFYHRTVVAPCYD